MAGEAVRQPGIKAAQAGGMEFRQGAEVWSGQAAGS